MPDAIEFLTSDHRNVDALFTQAQATTPPNREVIDSIVRELSTHDAIEKEYLYPTVREKVPNGDQIADRSIDEHQEQAELLVDLDKSEPGSAGEASLLTQLIASVKAHVAEEETITFPALRQSVTPDELATLGTSLAEGKQTAPTRPHPHAPKEGLGTKIAGAVSAPLDKARDAAAGRR